MTSSECTAECSPLKQHPILGTTDSCKFPWHGNMIYLSNPCYIALSLTIEGDELVAQFESGDTLRGGHVPLNTWSHVAIQQQSDKMVLISRVVAN